MICRWWPALFFLLVAGPAAAFPPPTPPDPAAKLKQYDSLWTDLVGEEAPATRALLKLSAKPDDAIALFAVKLKPLKIDEKTVRTLLADLNSDKDDVWKKAYETLDYFDPRLAIDLPTLMTDITDYPARSRMVAVLSGHYPIDKASDLEGPISLGQHTGENGEVYYNFRTKKGSSWAEHRVDRIGGSFGNMRKPWTRAVRSIALLEHIGTPSAVAVLKDLSTGHAYALPTRAAKEALGRLTQSKSP